MSHWPSARVHSRTQTVWRFCVSLRPDENSRQAERSARSLSLGERVQAGAAERACAGHAIGMQIRGRDDAARPVAHLRPIKIALNYARSWWPDFSLSLSLSFNLKIYGTARCCCTLKAVWLIVAFGGILGVFRDRLEKTSGKSLRYLTGMIYDRGNDRESDFFHGM